MGAHVLVCRGLPALGCPVCCPSPLLPTAPSCSRSEPCTAVGHARDFVDLSCAWVDGGESQGQDKAHQWVGRSTGDSLRLFSVVLCNV